MMKPIQKQLERGTVIIARTVVVTQLAELSLPTPEICGSNPVISEFYIEDLFTVKLFEKMIIKKNRAGVAHKKESYLKALSL